MEIAGLEEASRLLGGAVLGPQELAAALGFDPLAALGGSLLRGAVVIH